MISGWFLECELRACAICGPSFMGDQLDTDRFGIVFASPFMVQHIREIENIECDLQSMPSASGFDKEILHQLDINIMFEIKPIAIPLSIIAPVFLKVWPGN